MSEENEIEVKTLREVADEQALAISRAQSLKAEASKCAKAIHANGGEGKLWDMLGSGITVMSVTKLLGVSTSGLDQWLRRGGEDRMAAYTRARLRGGQSLAEETIEIADSATIEEVQLAKLRIEQRWRMAARLDPEGYGEQKGPLVNIDLGSLALDALRRRDV